MPQWVVTKQIAVEAETPEEAVGKINEGNTISFSVSLRPTPQAKPQPTPPARPQNLPAGMNLIPPK